MTSQQIQSVVDGCTRTLDLRQTEASAKHFAYTNVPLCILDAVFSINTKYTAVLNVVERYRTFAPQHAGPQHSVQDLVRLVTSLGPERFASEVVHNRQRTSSRSGILKAEAAHLFAQVLNEFDVRYLSDMPKVIDSDRFCRRIRMIPGQLLSLDYFLMMMGRHDLIKADRMILQFLSKCLGKRITSVSWAQYLIAQAVPVLAKEHRQLTPRLLDWIIWKHESKATAVSSSPHC